MDVVRELADRIIVLHNGALVADGEPAEVIASQGGAGGLSRRVAPQAGVPTPVQHQEAAVSDALAGPCEGVHTHIGAYHILHGVDLVVPRGQLTMLLGRNGVGKTTTLRTIMGLWPASKGQPAFQRPATSPVCPRRRSPA
jgi:ABC-type branched-subunit amino acid transport system ATPase component